MNPSPTAIDVALHEARRTVLQFWNWAELCHCGNPHTLLTTIAEGLDAHPVSGENDDESWSRTQAWIGGNLFGAYMLEKWGLTEHGSSIYGSWLTEDGIRLRDACRIAGADVISGSDQWENDEYALHPEGRPELDDEKYAPPEGYWKRDVRWDRLWGAVRAARTLAEAMDRTPVQPKVRDALAKLREALEGTT